MALPSSGNSISASQINTELGRTSTKGDSSMKNLSRGTNSGHSVGTGYGSINSSSTSKPNATAPYSWSEWYGYNHSASSTTSVNLYYAEGESAEACSGEIAPTYYHNGEGTYPAQNDQLFTNSGGTTAAADGYYRSPNQSTGFTLSEGTVGLSFACGRSERRLKYNIEFIGESPMGIPMYHFNYKDESHGKGRFVGTMVDDLQRLGFEDSLFEQNGEIWVNYHKLDVPFESVTN